MVASNPAIEMLKLSDRFTTTTGADQVAITGAAEAALARWEGTGFQVAYVIGQLAGIILGVLLLKRDVLGRAVPYTMIAGNAIGFAYYLPKIGLGLSTFSGVVFVGLVRADCKAVRRPRSDGSRSDGRRI
jgi:hypothetical protein